MDYLNAMLPVVVIGVVLLGLFFCFVMARRNRRSEQEAERLRLCHRLDNIESHQKRIDRRLDAVKVQKAQ